MKKILIIVLALAAIGGGVGYYLWNKPPESMAVQKADLGMPAAELVAAFAKDEAAANTQYVGKIIAVTGKVKEVCQVKGCWMTIVSDQPGQPEMRVTFKDYAFFMPKDISGKTVVVDGIAVMEVVSVADQQHYASDAGKSKEEIEKITEPSRELTFEASGVLIKG